MTDPAGAAIYGAPWIPSTKTPYTMLALIYQHQPDPSWVTIDDCQAEDFGLSWLCLFFGQRLDMTVVFCGWLHCGSELDKKFRNAQQTQMACYIK